MSAWIPVPAGRLRLRLHLLVPLAAAALWYHSPGLGARYLLLLGVLAMHELGHAAASLALGTGRSIVFVSPVFGWAMVERFSDRREGWVALAGPAANLLLAGGMWLAGAGFDLALARATLAEFVFTASLLMGAGNLLPVLPADGGRALAAFRRANAAQGEAAKTP